MSIVRTLLVAAKDEAEVETIVRKEMEVEGLSVLAVIDPLEVRVLGLDYDTYQYETQSFPWAIYEARVVFGKEE